MNHNYVEMHNFLEYRLANGVFRTSAPITGRVSVAGKYIYYIRKEVKAGQDEIVRGVGEWLNYNEAPEWVFSVFKFYQELSAEFQMCFNVLILTYLVFMQYYFIRYVLCDSCFKEWKQLNDEVAESERTLDERREAYEAEMARRKTNLE